MANKIYLGSIDGESLSITKHSWDCEWYFGFGYIGNKNLHTHFDTTFINTGYTRPDDCNFSEHDWYVICDYYRTAYALKEAYEVYYRGNSHVTSLSNVTSLKDSDMADRLKADQEKILNLVWDYMETHQLKG